MDSKPTAQLVLKRNQDRRVRSGHPWVFSNEIERFEGEPGPGALVDVVDSTAHSWAVPTTTRTR